MALPQIVRREPAAWLFAVGGLTAIVVLASLGEPVLGGLLVAYVVGYVSGRSVSPAGRDEMYRSRNDMLAIAWMTSLLLLAGLALDWIGFMGAAGDVSRLQAFAYAVPALCIVGFVYGAWHEHLECEQVHSEPGTQPDLMSRSGVNQVAAPPGDRPRP
jgi:heme/copper-type cytochrome/quinol oxidase subunit 3